MSSRQWCVRPRSFPAPDEFPCARRQDVMAAAFALRHLTLETQSRGKLHPHGIFYVEEDEEEEDEQ